MLRYRLIFGPIMIALLLGLLWLDDYLDRVDLTGTVWQDLFLGRTYLPAGLLMLALLLLLIVLVARELAAIFRAEGVEVTTFMVALSGAVGALLIYLIPYRLDSQIAIGLYASVLAAMFVLSLVAHSWRRRTEGAVVVASVTMFALVYIGTLPGFFLAIRRWHSAWIVAAIILIIKSADIGAYFTGRAVGRHKLIPWLSPGKTWEGFIGGLGLAALVALVLVALGNAAGLTGHWERTADTRVFVAYRLPLWFALLGGVLIGVVGQVGDLVASLFKRDAGIKDSGRSIPGFGGILDVMDSPIVVAPVAYWLLVMAPYLAD